jgi:hypothetical protein
MPVLFRLTAPYISYEGARSGTTFGVADLRNHVPTPCREGNTVRDTETKFGGNFRGVFARHRVLEFASLEMIKALPREDAARLAHELRARVGHEPPAIQDPPQLVIREWSFLKRPSSAEGSAAVGAPPCGAPTLKD